MGILRDRLVLADGAARLRWNGEAVTAVVGRLLDRRVARQIDPPRADLLPST